LPFKGGVSFCRERKMEWIHKYKPAASASTHIFLAALVWSGVGAMLLLRGILNLLALGPSALWPLPIYLVIGFLKGKFVLTKTAVKNVNRINCRPEEKHCIGGFMSWKAWLLVAAMIFLGRVLRASPLPRPVVWGIYSAIGTALLIGSLMLWKAWLAARKKSISSLEEV